MGGAQEGRKTPIGILALGPSRDQRCGCPGPLLFLLRPSVVRRMLAHPSRGSNEVANQGCWHVAPAELMKYHVCHVTGTAGDSGKRPAAT